LDEILLHTTNEKWEITFVDRTQPENKLLPMRKKLLLRNFGAYWTTNDSSEIFGHLVPAAIHKKMQRNILKNLSDQSIQDFIININAECKLTQKNRKDTKTKDDPEFDIIFFLAPVHLSIKKKQLQDMISLTSFLEEYKKFKFQALKEEQKEAQDFLSESQLLIQKDEFQMLFKKILTKDQDGLKNMLKVRAALDGPEQAQLFEELLLSMPDEEIAIAIKQSLKEIEKEKKLRELAEQKQEKGWKRAFFKNFFKSEKKEKQDDESLWEKEDITRIEKYLDQALANDNDGQEEMEEGKVKNLVKFKFISEAGSAILSNALENGSEQGITFQYTGLSCDVFMTSQSKKIEVDLSDFDLYLKTRYSSDKSFINTHVIRRVNYWLSPEKQTQIISLTCEDNPVGTYFRVKAQQVEVVYRKALIDRLKEFSQIIQEKQQVSQDSSVNEEAFEIKEQPTSSSLQEEAKRRFFDIDIKAPVIVVPFLQNGDLKSECWVLNLGHFIMKTKDAVTEEDQLYDKFELVLNNLKFQYYPTHALFNKLQKPSLEEEKSISLSLKKEEEEEQKMLFDLVEKFNLKVKIRQFLPGSEKKPEAKELARLSVDVLIPTLDLQLRDDVYKKLLQISAIFDFSVESKHIEMAENERVKLMKGHDKLGTLYMREKKTPTEWIKHFCVLNGSYLYFFKNADDQRPALTFSLKNAKLQNYHDDVDRQQAFCVIL